MKQN
jgi:DNA-binding HxlR family transcriptional regulator